MKDIKNNFNRVFSIPFSCHSCYSGYFCIYEIALVINFYILVKLYWKWNNYFCFFKYKLWFLMSFHECLCCTNLMSRSHYTPYFLFKKRLKINIAVCNRLWSLALGQTEPLCTPHSCQLSGKHLFEERVYVLLNSNCRTIWSPIRQEHCKAAV